MPGLKLNIVDREIRIKNIKGISNLQFKIPQGGLHLLTGSNGSGKTTLMACLERLKNSYAFQNQFKTSDNSRIDQFTGSITYTFNGRAVVYRYGGKRWTPRPRSLSSLLARSGFRSASFISHSGARFYVQDRDLDTSDIRRSSASLKANLNRVLETTKFDGLRQATVGNTQGPGGANRRRNVAFLISDGGSPAKYYSEKNFSLGELLIINTLYELESLPQNSLLLIDEMEMALHPRMQVNLLELLEEIATQKSCTIIVSTHSASLIKSGKRLIYLDKEANGDTSVTYDAYPAQILNNLAYEGDLVPDYVFYVEDDNAEILLNSLMDRYFHLTNKYPRPIVRILPVGGKKQTLVLFNRSFGTLYPPSTGVYCLPDKDVEIEINTFQADPHRSPGQQRLLDAFNLHRQNVVLLPITPEEGLANMLENGLQVHSPAVSAKFPEGPVHLSQLFQAEVARGLTRPGNPRKVAKQKLDYIVPEIMTRTNLTERQVMKRLFDYYAEVTYTPASHGALLGLLNPIFN